MIYIHPLGGLGNCLFHIAAIWSLAKDNNDELCLLGIDEKIKIMKSGENWNAPHADDYMYLFNRFAMKNGVTAPVLHYPFIYVPIVYKPEHEYYGYFQSEKNFKHRRNDIIKLFSPPIEFEERINKYSDLFGNISLHVRRGNYLNSSNINIHPVQTMEYYNKSISILPKNLKILVFSDDMLWCKENFIGDRFVFVDEIDYISLYIMSKMKHHIIANSSFSWWGAWISQYNDKIVIAPQKWLGEGVEDTRDLIPENWPRI
jgi:hypothetical protein